MNPFDAPPSTEPVPLPPPSPGPASSPRRGRTALVAVATAGLLGAGIVGVGALASADDPGLSVSATPTTQQTPITQPTASTPPADTSVPAETADDQTGDDQTGDETGDDQTGDDQTGDDQTGDGRPSVEIRVDQGDGEPFVVELDGEDLGAFQECMGMPMLGGAWLGDGEFDLQIDDMLGQFEELFGELPDLDRMLQALPDPANGEGDIWQAFPGADGTVTVLGPDGPTIVDLGDGDGSVTVSRDAETGAVTITTEGTATEQDLGAIFAPHVVDGEWLDEMPNFDEMPSLEGMPELGGILPHIDPDQMSQCLADLGIDG